MSKEKAIPLVYSGALLLLLLATVYSMFSEFSFSYGIVKYGWNPSYGSLTEVLLTTTRFIVYSIILVAIFLLSSFIVLKTYKNTKYSNFRKGASVSFAIGLAFSAWSLYLLELIGFQLGIGGLFFFALIGACILLFILISLLGLIPMRKETFDGIVKGFLILASSIFIVFGLSFFFY